MSTQSGIPHAVQQLNTGTFQIWISLSNLTKPGQDSVTAAVPFTESCNGNPTLGQIGFTVQMIAQMGPVHPNPSPAWLIFFESHWWVFVVMIILVASGIIVAVKRTQDE
ncbi:MAG: hypothetical protein ACRDF4_01385 [Rhabdochlamydiaceae bacterium]